MNLLAVFFPTTFLVIVLGIVIGFILSFIFFGSISVIALYFLIYIGVIRIMPLLNIIQSWIKSIFPITCKKLRTHISQSFPVKQLADIPEKGIYVIHPHGLFNMAHLMHVGTKFTAWPERNIQGTALYSLWRIPFVNELLEAFVPSNYDAMKHVLDSGKSLSLSLGGLAEAYTISPERFCLKIKDRKGAFKLAIETGTPLVPVLVYGENEIFEVMKGPSIDMLAKVLNYVNIPFMFPTFQSIWKTMNLIREPYDIKVSTFIGSPIEVEIGTASKDRIECLRNTYMKKLEELYKETRPAHYPDTIEFF